MAIHSKPNPTPYYTPATPGWYRELLFPKEQHRIAQILTDKRAERGDKDFTHPGISFSRFRAGVVEASSFLACSVPNPILSARNAAASVHRTEQSKGINHLTRQRIVEKARAEMAQLINLQSTEGVALLRNTTEAMSYLRWLSNTWAIARYPKKLEVLFFGHVLLSDFENPSVAREIEFIRDAGNINRSNSNSSYSNWHTMRGARYIAKAERKSGMTPVLLKLFGRSLKEMKRRLAFALRVYQPRAIILSHVDRNTGRELPVRQLIRFIRERQVNRNGACIFIMIDGAQALGNVPRVDFNDLGCDAYIASPHKTLRSEVIGVLYFDTQRESVRKGLAQLKSVDRREQVVLDGMFHPAHQINANVPDTLSTADLVALLQAVKAYKQLGLNGSDFSAIYARRQALRDDFVDKLKILSNKLDIKLSLPKLDKPTPFIQSFRYPGIDQTSPAKQDTNKADKIVLGHLLAKRLAENAVFISYLRNSNLLRAAFEPYQTMQDIDRFMEVLESVLQEPEFLALRK